MTRYLLGTLEGPERERVTERLARDRAFFEAMASLDDDLILRYHRGQLRAEERASFATAYLSSPPRRARVEETLALLDAARAWKSQDDVRGWRAVVRWLSVPQPLPRMALVAGAAVLVVALAYLAAGPLRPRSPSQDGSARPAPRTIVAFTLTAVGERGPGSTSGMDRILIPSDAEEVRLAIVFAGEEAAGPLDAELTPLDGRPPAPLAPPRVDRAGGFAVATVTVAPSVLADGDYVLRLRRVTSGVSEVMATRTFRVAHVAASIG